MNTKKRLYLMIAAVALIAVIVFAVRFLYTPDTAASIEEQIYLIQEGSSDFPDYPDEEKEILNIGVGNITGDFDPRTANTAGDRAVSRIVYEPLIDADRTGAPVAVLAEKYEISEDGCTYTFTIPAGVVFSDGTEVTAEGVAENIIAANSTVFTEEDMVWVDENEVSFVFPQADRNNIWLFRVGIQPAEQLDAGESKKEHIGTGAYKIQDDGTQDEMVVLERNENYRGKDAVVAEVHLVQSDTAALHLDFTAGQLDLAYFGYNETQLEQLQELEFLDLYAVPGNSSSFLGFNMDLPALDEQDVRLAFAYGIQYERILNLYDGQADINPSPFSSVSWQTPGNLERYAYDVEKAEEYLKSAGYKKGESGYMEKDGEALIFTIVTYKGINRRNVCDLISEDLAALGIGLEIEQYDYQDYYDKVFIERDYDLYYGTWQFGLTDNVEQRFGEPGGEVNPEGWYSKEVESLIEKIQSEMDYQKLEKHYQDLARLYHEQAPQIPLDTPKSIVAASSYLEGLQLSPYVPAYWNVKEMAIKNK